MFFMRCELYYYCHLLELWTTLSSMLTVLSELCWCKMNLRYIQFLIMFYRPKSFEEMSWISSFLLFNISLTNCVRSILNWFDEMFWIIFRCSEKFEGERCQLKKVRLGPAVGKNLSISLCVPMSFCFPLLFLLKILISKELFLWTSLSLAARLVVLWADIFAASFSLHIFSFCWFHGITWEVLMFLQIPSISWTYLNLSYIFDDWSLELSWRWFFLSCLILI